MSRIEKSRREMSRREKSRIEKSGREKSRRKKSRREKSRREKENASEVRRYRWAKMLCWEGGKVRSLKRRVRNHLARGERTNARCCGAKRISRSKC